jgi:hypothetical protein
LESTWHNVPHMLSDAYERRKHMRTFCQTVVGRAKIRWEKLVLRAPIICT